MTKDEKDSVKIFLQDGTDEVQISTTSFVQNTLQAAQLKKVANKYKSTKYVFPTSNLCERLFSRASLIMTPNRRKMDPETFETIIMLKSNKDLWDAETVQQCMVRISSTVPPSEVIPENTTSTTISGSKRAAEEISCHDSNEESSNNSNEDDISEDVCIN